MDYREVQVSRLPNLKPSSKFSRPFAWIAGYAPDPSLICLVFLRVLSKVPNIFILLSLQRAAGRLQFCQPSYQVIVLYGLAGRNYLPIPLVVRKIYDIVPDRQAGISSSGGVRNPKVFKMVTK